MSFLFEALVHGNTKPFPTLSMCKLLLFQTTHGQVIWKHFQHSNILPIETSNVHWMCILSCGGLDVGKWLTKLTYLPHVLFMFQSFPLTFWSQLGLHILPLPICLLHLNLLLMFWLFEGYICFVGSFLLHSYHQIKSIHKKLCWLHLFVIVARSYSFLLRFMSDEWMGAQAGVWMLRLKFRRFACYIWRLLMCNELLYAIASLLRNSNVKNIKTLHNCTTSACISLCPCQHEIYPTLLSSTKKWGF